MTEQHTTPEPAAANEYMRATRQGRLLAGGLFALSIAVVAAFFLVGMPLLNTAMQPGASAAALLPVKIMLAALAAGLIVSAIFMIHGGLKILRSGQCPAPDTWVWRDTPIRRGRNAQHIGRLQITSGVLACIVCAAAMVYIWIMFDRTIPSQAPLQEIMPKAASPAKR